MPALPDSHPEKWVYDLHTWLKHRILSRYLSPWTRILGSGGRSLAYVDGFAGRGRYITGEPGSPLLVLDAMADASSIPWQSVCHFVEQDEQNFTNLKSEVERHPAVQAGRVQYRLYNSTFSAASGSIIGEIRRLRQASFFFVDPFGYDDPTMDLLGQILSLDRSEILVNLMFNFANRAVSVSDNPSLALTLDRLFGSEDWRRFAHTHGTEREREFVDLYREQLRSRGARHVVRFRMGDDTVNRTLYYLVHAAKHPKGGMLMKDVMVALASPGELGYAGERRHQSIPLFDYQIDQLPEFLLRKFAGRTVSFDDTIAQTLEDTGTATAQEKDYRRCLKELESVGRVSIRRISSVRLGLKGQDRITFPPQ